MLATSYVSDDGTAGAASKPRMGSAFDVWPGGLTRSMRSDGLRPHPTGRTLHGVDHPGNGSHSVPVAPAKHRVSFPLASGPNGTPVPRIMRPAHTQGLRP
jgi:hypothetical protein